MPRVDEGPESSESYALVDKVAGDSKQNQTNSMEWLGPAW